MAKGGARAVSGPPPNPNSRRQTGNQAHTWTDLPADGFDGLTPAWPLTEATSREADVWAEVWRTPHAAAWARLGWSHDVAMYVRFLVLAESGDLKAATESRQWSDRLGLNPAAMLRNRWRIRVDEVGEQRAAKKKPQRRRLVVADAVEA